MRNVGAVFSRELASYFATPVAYIFIVIFLALASALTFYVGYFFERGQADLQTFFNFHPWLYLFLMPAISMRLWAEERKTGTIELLLTLPIETWQASLGKFLAAWAFAAVALALTFPLWITVNWLGEPDNGVIVASYIGSLLMAGSYLAIGTCISALTKNQVIAFVLTIAICFLFTVSGSAFLVSMLGDLVSRGAVETVAAFSFLTHFNQIIKGVIDLRALVFFAAVIVAWLMASVILVDLKKAD